MTYSSETPKKCGLVELLVFCSALILGSLCSLCSKVMMDMHGQGMTGQVEQFSNPIFQTFGMFVGMMFGLVMHFSVLYWKLPFPGYHNTSQEQAVDAELRLTEKDPLLTGKRYSQSEEDPPLNPPLPLSMYFQIAIPATFDLGATALCMLGLRYLDVSIYQLLRGSGVIFVALLKQFYLRHKLYNFQWVGVFWNVISVVIVGIKAVMDEKEPSEQEDILVKAGGSAFLGIVFVLAGAFVQALQYVYEEKMMNLDIPAPPLLLIGMEGLWGTILCVLVVYPLVYFLPGDDHGSYENPFNTWYMIMHSTAIQWMFVLYFFAIFGYNLFGVLTTYLMNSIWHAILDNFRPITVWMADLFIHYAIVPSFGEEWNNWSYLQLLGMCVLLYGSAIYNGPNDGSILLKGEWFALGLDFSKEYLSIQMEEEEISAEAEWELKQLAYQKRSNSSFIGDRPPFVAGPTLQAAHHHHLQSPIRASHPPSRGGNANVV